MKRVFLLLTFIFGNLSILIVSVLFLTVFTTRGSSAVSVPTITAEVSESTVGITGSQPYLPGSLVGEVILEDARAKIIDQFFQRYRSPMEGLGNHIVTTADKYKIPYGLLPAIGQCEGNVGKVIPLGSYNTWGYGIYGSTIKKFDSWEAGIEAVSADLRLNYFNRGLDTPEEIMTKYAPSSNGSWANCVNSYLQELR